ncbi:MAG: DUF1501 domain-containing protein [Pirellulaceae bacterium]|nr:DUF1501 domain-containing protein [Pirellulaceae bacterium]
MLRIFGRTNSACDRLMRRDLLAVGGLSLFGGMSLPRLLQASQSAGRLSDGTAKSVVLLNLFGGPPHQDMFDLKPNAPENVRGEFKPISTSVPGLQISELLPLTAQLMDRATLIRTYSHKYNSHNPYNVLTGYDGGVDAENYYAKVTDHPGMGSICQYLGLGSKDVPRYVMMPAFPGYTQALRRAGPYGGYLGSRYDPLFTVCDPAVARESKDDYDPVEAIGYPTLPSLEAQPGMTAEGLAGRGSLLEKLDKSLAQLENSGAVARLNDFKQQAFNLLSSSKTREAFDIKQESTQVREDYGHNLWGSSMLIARRLVEAGSKFITIHWESAGKNHWDLHGNNFGMLRVHSPQLDRLISAFVLDLEKRGLLDSTLFVVMGEMGRTPTINKKAGRDHWPQCGFSLLFGGGTRRGAVVGKTDNHAAYPIERPVSAGDMVATIYRLLGVNPELTVDDLGGRPVHIAHGGQPVAEVIA